MSLSLTIRTLGAGVLLASAAWGVEPGKSNASFTFGPGEMKGVAKFAWEDIDSVLPLFRVISGPDGTTLATEMASQRSGIHVILQTSPDLTSWQDLDLESLEVSQTPHDGNALDSVTYRGLPDAPTRYLRFQATLAP